MANAVQKHIHLSATLGSAPENAPNMTWPVVDREDISEIVAAFNRSKKGKFQPHVLSDGSGPIQFSNYRYVIRVSEQDSDSVWDRAADLKAMQGKQVYFVDVYHEADGNDHTTQVRTMYLTQVGAFPKFDQMLTRFYVDIEVTDGDTVT